MISEISSVPEEVKAEEAGKLSLHIYLTPRARIE